MYNLLVHGNGWPHGSGPLQTDRVLTYTSPAIAARYRNGDAPNFAELMTLPCLFMQEGRRRDQTATLGRIHAVIPNGRNYRLEYTMEQGFPAFSNADIYERHGEFGIDNDFEFGNSHWAVKDVDLFRSLLRIERPERSLPTAFTIPRLEAVDAMQISVMMPFDGSCAGVYQDISEMAARMGIRCNRGDDIWQNDHILQDIVSLIDRSRIVICDLTGKNPNVLYETGIAHTLSRQTILLTQSREDVPFDLRPIRYIPYLNNPQGRADMIAQLERRIGEIYAAAF